MLPVTLGGLKGGLQTRRVQVTTAVAFSTILLCLVLQRLSSSSVAITPPWSPSPWAGPSTANANDVVLVVASQSKDNTSWAQTAFPTWRKAIYVTDAAGALRVPANKGHEGMVYLTYITDNYERLPNILIFQHADRYQWHNDDPLYDGKRLLEQLRLEHVQQEGYVNLRCAWSMGCPSTIRPQEEAGGDDEVAGSHYKAAYEYMFPGDPVPDTIGGACCAQFAVSATQVLQRPKADYERYRQWLLDTPLHDQLSGRIMEFTWHIIFGKPAVHCRKANECYCETYGLCSLECEDDGLCQEQYQLTAFLPEGWPDVGLDGKWQNATQMLIDHGIEPSESAEITSTARDV